MKAVVVKKLINQKSGNLFSFAKEVEIPYTTLVSSLNSDKQFERMPIKNFIKVAHALGMTADELIETIKKEEREFEALRAEAIAESGESNG